MKHNGVEKFRMVGLAGKPQAGEEVRIDAEMRGEAQMRLLDAMVETIVTWSMAKWPKEDPERIGFALRKAATRVYRQHTPYHSGRRP